MAKKGQSKLFGKVHNIRKAMGKIEGQLYAVQCDLEAVFNEAYDLAWQNPNEKEQDDGSEFAGKLEEASGSFDMVYEQVNQWTKEYTRIIGQLPKGL